MTKCAVDFDLVERGTDRLGFHYDSKLVKVGVVQFQMVKLRLVLV